MEKLPSNSDDVYDAMGASLGTDFAKTLMREMLSEPDTFSVEQAEARRNLINILNAEAIAGFDTLYLWTDKLAMRAAVEQGKVPKVGIADYGVDRLESGTLR